MENYACQDMNTYIWNISVKNMSCQEIMGGFVVTTTKKLKMAH